MKLLPSRRVLCTPYNHAPCHFMQSHIRKVYACLAVTCHLHFGRNDRGLLRATAVTRGWNGYRNKSQHRKLTLAKEEFGGRCRKAMLGVCRRLSISCTQSIKQRRKNKGAGGGSTLTYLSDVWAIMQSYSLTDNNDNMKFILGVRRIKALCRVIKQQHWNA